MIDLHPDQLGQIVPDFESAEYESYLATIKWAYDRGYVDTAYEIDSFDELRNEIESMDEDDFSWYVIMNMPSYIRKHILVWINANLPHGFVATWDRHTGISIEREDA